MSDEQKDQPHIPMAKAQNETAAFFDHQTGRFFRRVDWAAFWTSFIVSFGVYVYTLAPTVTLEDSGELAVAADYLGVPHPPGYPIWTLLSWLFQWVFHWKKYLGYPNPAWSVGLLSAFFGALACGTLSLLISRSGADMLRSIRKMTDVLGIETESLICWAGAVAGGLLLAFSPVLWSQSVIVEVYSLNAFFLVIILLLTYVWMCRPKDDKVLYITAFVFGLGLTNHQTLLFVAIALLAAIWFRDRRLFRDCFAVMCVAIAFFLFWKVGSMDGELNPDALREKHLKQIMAVLFLVTPIGLFFIERRLMTEWKRVMFLALLAALGVSFYAYMPFSSEQNPPMNWGYPRTQEGFKHAITRGQYERITPSEIFGNPKKFAEQVGAYFRDLRGQFTLPIALLGIIPFFFLRKIDRRGRGWVITTVWAFLSLSIILVIFLNPQLDIQTLFIQRVQLIQSHAIYALWIGYGLVFGLAFAETLLGGRGVTKFVGVGLVVLLPLVMIWDNAYNEERVRVVGGVEQNGHDFGWQFGAWELEGARQINKELKETEPPLPNPDYPVPMETNAIFFGGTDPGRFVPTYMIYSAKMRSD
ncbi:MAG: DUF2723 domain-containing protein, partial [Verrucomicrobia bacterium]|nr:DUF2723 domain-containing protein [Verrucomicrobiota bacterium]